MTLTTMGLSSSFASRRIRCLGMKAYYHEGFGLRVLIVDLGQQNEEGREILGYESVGVFIVKELVYAYTEFLVSGE